MFIAAKKNRNTVPLLKLHGIQNLTKPCSNTTGDTINLMKEKKAPEVTQGDSTDEESLLFESNSVMDNTRMSSDNDITFGPDFLLSDFYSSLLKCELSGTSDEHPKPIKKIEHKCPTCSKVFATSNYLNRHMVTHTGVKAFGCSRCTKRFYFKWALKQHLLRHMKERPFECSTCGKRFFNSWLLKKYLYTHNQEKSYRCGACSKRFCSK